jgi:diguanylate cyclase (GGDEF)-like protein/PAS domain S-box-containing protein
VRNNPNDQDKEKLEAEANFARQLRDAAEKKLTLTPHPDTSTRPVNEILHELQVYQIELEMQNDELRRTQQLIEESRDRYVDFYDFAPVGYITLSRDALIEEINLAGATLLGEERGKLLHRRFATYIAPEDRDHWYQYFTSVLQRDYKLTCELATLRGDGSRLTVQLDGVRLQRDDKLSVVRIVLTDITERKLIEDSVREKEEFFRMIAENTEDFIAVLDLEGRRVYNSPSYARLFGNPERLKGTDSFAEIHPDDREHVKSVFNKTVQTGTGLQIEYRFVLPDGSIRHMESVGGLIKNNHDQASRVIVVSRDITGRKQTEEKIRSLAYFDTLTQLPNRRMLDDRLSLAMAASKRSGRYGALMFLDLDNFKPLNDLHGHGAGDLLLKEVARPINGCVREVDTVARFGGDEFVVVLNELDADNEASATQAGVVAEKIRAALAEPYVLNIQQTGKAKAIIEHRCTSSIGVMLFINHAASAEDILKWADMAMYQAKEAGRNSIRFYNSKA